MLPAWFLQAIAEILQTQKEQSDKNLELGTSQALKQPSLTLIKTLQIDAEKLAQHSKIDKSLVIRRTRRLIEKQIIHEFGKGFLGRLNPLWKTVE